MLTELDHGARFASPDKEIYEQHKRIQAIAQGIAGLPSDLQTAFGCMRDSFEERRQPTRLPLPPSIQIPANTDFHRLSSLNGHGEDVGVLVGEWDGGVRHGEHEVNHGSYRERQHVHALSRGNEVVAVVLQGMDVFIPGTKTEDVLGRTAQFLRDLNSTHKRHHPSGQFG